MATPTFLVGSGFDRVFPEDFPLWWFPRRRSWERCVNGEFGDGDGGGECELGTVLYQKKQSRIMKKKQIFCLPARFVEGQGSKVTWGQYSKFTARH